MNFERSLGLTQDGGPAASQVDPLRRRRQVNLALIAAGLPADAARDREFAEVTEVLIGGFAERVRLLSRQRCPADKRIERFLQQHFADVCPDVGQHALRLPETTLALDRHGVARELSVPADSPHFPGRLVDSYRVRNGVLHNPLHDRRTTQGTFHVTEGGLPIPGDKRAVPKSVFAAMFRQAVKATPELLALPFHCRQNPPVQTWVSLLLRPVVCPAVPLVCTEKSMEVRFFAPGSLISNLDFVESIFGNAGDPFLPGQDAALDVEHWTGHTGCVILAPDLINVTKKELGLPHVDQATDRQRRDRMCWENPDEKYNDGSAFKLTCRTEAGVIVTLIADNYYGYCKKEVKTQISYAANLYGNVEEEHSGGALAFPSYSLGDEFIPDSRVQTGRTFDDVVRDYGADIDVRPEGYAIDRTFPALIYIPEDARASISRQEVWWTREGREQAIRLTPGHVYITPSGFKVRMEKHPGAPSWRLNGTSGEGTFCHKPCTVSGGGKSEISKPLRDYMIYGPVFVADEKKDLDLVGEILDGKGQDYSRRWKPEIRAGKGYEQRKSRKILSPERSLGSVIKLLTPSADYTDEYNAWLDSIPNYIYPLVFIIKRFYKPDWNGDWRSHFGVDIVNGFPGHELKYGDRILRGSYLRVGLLPPRQGSGAAPAWRTYKARQDFVAAVKIQTEDDISASVVVPAAALGEFKAIAGKPALNGDRPAAYKFVTNCEYRLFQRPDDAVHRGLDRQTEADLARPDNFISNFQPLTAAEAAEMAAQVTQFDAFTAPMRSLLKSAAASAQGYVVSSSNPRLVNGKPSKNPRYLQVRPDLTNRFGKFVAERGARLYRATPADRPVYTPVDAVLAGRRNNPPDKAAGIRALAVYNPIHYQHLPELFMDFISSLTGKSPSTTGAGSEGALTKGPFNALRPVVDLNNALVSYILTGLGGFSTAAGYIGPDVRVDHDISLLVPEIWCRLSPRERDPYFLIKESYLEPVPDRTHDGETIHASRLGYRITARFVAAFFGRVFDNPSKVFDEAILKPETQNLDDFIDGVRNITEAHQRVAEQYFDDGSIADACPPLAALLTIMAKGTFEGKDVHHPDIRGLFDRGRVLNSDWYHKRLKAKQQRDIDLWGRHHAYVTDWLTHAAVGDEQERSSLKAKQKLAAEELERVSGKAYLESLAGCLGADPTLTGGVG